MTDHIQNPQSDLNKTRLCTSAIGTPHPPTERQHIKATGATETRSKQKRNDDRLCQQNCANRRHSNRSLTKRSLSKGIVPWLCQSSGLVYVQQWLWNVVVDISSLWYSNFLRTNPPEVWWVYSSSMTVLHCWQMAKMRMCTVAYVTKISGGLRDDPNTAKWTLIGNDKRCVYGIGEEKVRPRRAERISHRKCFH